MPHSSFGSAAAHWAAGALLLIGAATAGAAKLADAAPGVAGELWARRACPVGQNCPAVLWTLTGASVEVVRPDGQVAGLAYTNAQGRFVVSVPLGAYTLRVLTGANTTCPALAVMIEQPKFKSIAMVCATTDEPSPIALQRSAPHAVSLARSRA